MVAIADWKRLMSDERDWLNMPDDLWESLMGWPNTYAEDQAFEHRGHEEIGLSSDPPERRSNAPPLLTVAEIDELRKYPGGIMSFVLLGWALQTVQQENLMNAPNFNPFYQEVCKLRHADYAIRNMLQMP
eukprot:5256119-Prymnesium_polylepis.1